MSVRLLAGPFQCTTPDGTILGVGPDSGYLSFGNNSAWWPHVGLITMGYFHANDLSGTQIVTLDGVAGGGMCRYNPNWSWWPARQQMVSMYGGYYIPDVGGAEIVFESRSFSYQYVDPADFVDDPNSGALGYRRYVKLADRRIWSDGNHMWRQTKGLPDEIEASVPQGLANLYAGRSDTDVFLSGTFWDGHRNRLQGCFYDTVAKKIVSPMYIVADTPGERTSTLVYASEFGVLMTAGYFDADSNGYSEGFFTRVWSLEVEPAVLSAPAIVSGTVRSGQVVTYRVQLTGADNDPAENELIDWVLTGAGVLLDVQTKTDANGYATTRVQYRVGETGNSTVTASVSC